MAVFVWRGIDPRGRTVKGVLDADNPKALRASLKRDGVLVTEVLEESAARTKKGREVDLSTLFKRVTTLDVAMMTRQLATLLKSGIPLVEALSALIEQQEKPALKTALTQTRDKVNEGTSFADALRAHPKIFPHLYVNLVAAGEASGTLEIVLARLAEYIENQAKLRTKVTAALAYPGFMTVLTVVVIFVLMTVVVPRVTAIFSKFDAALPWYTELLVNVSWFFGWFWWLILLVIVGGVWGFIAWKNTPKGREKWHRFVLKAPLFGRLALLIAVTRFARTLATLLSGGVPILRAMEITKNVLGNAELEQVIDDARNSVREGESIAVPLKRSGRFPPIVVHMIAIGERSGQLEEMLENVATAYEVQVENRITAMTALLEPLIIVVMGVVVGSIAFSIIMPILKINQLVSGGG
jgi:general secretion pathway protein F